MMVSFTIPGKVTSANRVTRRVGNRSVKSASARLDMGRIRDHALAVSWQDPRVPGEPVMPTLAQVTIVAHNSRLDADNVCKCILDGIKGVLIVNDSPKHLRRLVVEHERDKLGERYVVTVVNLA